MPHELLQPLERQVALVTGASSGIGKASAIKLSEAGAAVVVNYAHNAERAEAVAHGIREHQGRATTCRADVSNESDVVALFKHTLREFGRLDILVNNAGIQNDAPVLDMSLDQWNDVLSVNLTGQFLCAREAARIFVSQGVQPQISRAAGKIICISSVHEQIPWAGHVNYAASKSGGIQLVMTMAQEFAPHRIRVNSIAPGAIKTSINRDVWESPEARAELLGRIPYGRVGEPEDVANAVVWLASDLSDYIDGATLFVDGGMTLYPSFAEGR